MFKKKPAALAMLGNLENVRQLTALFDSNGIKLIDKDYVTAEELMQGIIENKASYVLIADTALTGIEDGKREIIKQIRSGHKDVFIAMFFNAEKPDENFKNWAFGYGVYNLYFAIDGKGNYDFSKIMPELVERSMPVISSGEVQIVDREIEVIKEVPVEVERIVEKPVEVIKEVRVPVETIVEVEKPVIREVIKEVEKEVIREVPIEVEKIIEKEIYIKEKGNAKLMGNVMIGIFNLAHGAGATTTAVHLAQSFEESGFSTAVVAYDDKIDLHYLDKKAKGDFFIPAPGEKKLKLLEAFRGNYQFIILDFGNLFDILPNGRLNTSGLVDRKEAIEEFMRCSYKIGVGFTGSWNIQKLNYFIGNDAFDDLDSFVFSLVGLGDANVKGLMRSNNLNLCDRDSDSLMEIMYRLLGLQRQEEKRDRWLKGKTGRSISS